MLEKTNLLQSLSTWIKSINEENEGSEEIDGTYVFDESTHDHLSHLVPLTLPLTFLPVMSTSGIERSQQVCEIASKHLLMILSCTKQAVPLFSMLPLPSQVFLLTESWAHLLLLLLQETDSLSSLLINVATMLQSNLTNVQPGKTSQLANALSKIHGFMQKMERLELNPKELTFLMISCLYSSDQKDKNLSDFSRKIMNSVTKAFENMSEDRKRLTNIVFLLGELRSMNSDLIEELFFPVLRENVRIPNLIPYLLSLGPPSAE